MTAYEVRSINRHQMAEITYHFTTGWVDLEMECRKLCGHSAIQSRQVEVKPAPWAAAKPEKPGRRREGGKV